MKLISKEMTIRAPASEVYRYLTTADGLTRWMAVEATAEATPGGKLEWTHENGATMVGRFIELEPDRRVVFAYGWKDDLMGVPPSSTVVEIELEGEDDATTLRLTHSGVPTASIEEHAHGWGYFLDQLIAAIAR